jgi:hypothetical protein
LIIGAALQGTNRTGLGKTDDVVLPSIWAELGLDFFNGDTMSFINADFFNNSIADGDPLGIQPEGGPELNSLEWTKASRQCSRYTRSSRM